MVATELLQHDLDASPLFPRWEVPGRGRSRFEADLEFARRKAQAEPAWRVGTRDELADLATDELTDITGQTPEDATALIMKAREHWFTA